MGYHFQPRPGAAGTVVDLQPAQALERFNARVSRLYEQGADEGRIGDYVRRGGRSGWGWDTRQLGKRWRRVARRAQPGAVGSGA